MKTRRLFLSLCLLGLPGTRVASGQVPAAEAIPNWPAPSAWEPSAFDRSAGVSGEDAGSNQVSLLSANSPMPFIAITPCRLVDTRGMGFTGPWGPPALVAGATRNFDLNSAPHCPDVAATAQAYSLNVTVTQTQGPGDIRIWPTGSVANVSTQNWSSAGVTLANAAVVAAGTNGSITVQAAVSGAHLIIDINGYYAGTAVGDWNTFLGLDAGNSSMTGNSNTGIGAFALSGNTMGSLNTAIGRHALPANTTGVANTASGVAALFKNTTGGDNTADGYAALGFNTSGSFNTATGVQALAVNNSGTYNTAVGNDTLFNNTTGTGNTAIGNSALINVTGDLASYNIGIGNNGGSSLTTGSENICIGNFGVAGESLTIRIGQNQIATYIAGISGRNSPSGVGVLINSSGKLGTSTSSRRFKEGIREIAEESEGLMRLRPVVFRYKPEIDPDGLIQYGLIAEEVAEVYPDLVAYGPDGRPETVRYHLVNALLLSEVQKQRRSIESQRVEINSLKERLSELEARLSRDVPGRR